MNTGSLQEVMNRMSGRVDTLLDAETRKHPAADLGDEIRFWINADPLLGSLHKQYMDARSAHVRLMKLAGRGDAMADVAADMVDSAKSAFETRLIEARRLNEIRCRVNSAMKKAAEEMEEERREHSRALRTRLQLANARDVTPAQAKNSFWTTIMLWFALQEMVQITRAQLSAVSAFASAASDIGLKRRFAGF